MKCRLITPRKHPDKEMQPARESGTQATVLKQHTV